MPLLSFTILPTNITQLHDALACLAKFSDTVSIEAQTNSLQLSSLNTTKSAYSSFLLDGSNFFSKFSFSPESQATGTGQPASEKFSCQIYNKALISVFNGRPSDTKDKDTAVERCEVEVQEESGKAECRFMIKMICRHGVVRTYRLTYETVQAQHAIFDKARVQNQWKIESRYLREIIDYFGARTENLDVSPHDGKVTFTSYTEKVSSGSEILKHPVHTSVSIEQTDFEDFMVQEDLHIGISVKDFRAIVAHAYTLKGTITARYTRPGRPLQLAYETDAMICEFTLMTRGDSTRGSTESRAATPQTTFARAHSTNRTVPPPRQSARPSVAPSSEMVPPPRPASRRKSPDTATQRKAEAPTASTAPPSTSLSNSLFFPADDDRQWDEPTFEEEEDDMLGWDASADNDAFRTSMASRLRDDEPVPALQNRSEEVGQETTIAPTQRLSQIRGIFD